MLSLSFQKHEWACKDHWAFEKSQPHRRMQVNTYSPDPREDKVEENCLSHSKPSDQRLREMRSHTTEADARRITHTGSKENY